MEDQVLGLKYSIKILFITIILLKFRKISSIGIEACVLGSSQELNQEVEIEIKKY